MDNWNLIKSHDFAKDENQTIQFLKEIHIHIREVLIVQLYWNFVIFDCLNFLLFCVLVVARSRNL